MPQGSDLLPHRRGRPSRPLSIGDQLQIPGELGPTLRESDAGLGDGPLASSGTCDFPTVPCLWTERRPLLPCTAVTDECGRGSKLAAGGFHLFLGCPRKQGFLFLPAASPGTAVRKGFWKFLLNPDLPLAGPDPYWKAVSSSLGYCSPSLPWQRLPLRGSGKGVSPNLCAAHPWRLAALCPCLAATRGTPSTCHCGSKCCLSLPACWTVSGGPPDTNAFQILSARGEAERALVPREWAVCSLPWHLGDLFSPPT